MKQLKQLIYKSLGTQVLFYCLGLVLLFLLWVVIPILVFDLGHWWMPFLVAASALNFSAIKGYLARI
jgi:hypothetical protein